MVSRKVIFACAVLAILDASTAQVIKNFLPNCGCGCSGVDVISNQVLLNQPGLFASGVLAQPGLVAQPGLLAPSGIFGPGVASGVVGPVCGQYAVPSSNIIQDNTVATNLANTLQLLLVSNLLSNTLPNSPDIVSVPAVSPYATGLSYIC